MHIGRVPGYAPFGVLRNSVTIMPDSLRFLLIVLCLAGAGYGLVWGLANYPPDQKEVIKQLSNGVFKN